MADEIVWDELTELTVAEAEEWLLWVQSARFGLTRGVSNQPKVVKRPWTKTQERSDG